MESEILHQTTRISSRLWAMACLSLICCASATASPLFDDDAVLDIALSGPLGTIVADKRDEDRVEYPFVLTVDDKEIPVSVRVRGHSRTVYCAFPPLRLRFHDTGTEETPFAGQDKLKLVTHCRNDREHYETNLLDEYTAYRIFNLISAAGYRVRLLRVTYDDTDRRRQRTDRVYFGFVIESDDELAGRLGGTVAELEGVLYSRLNEVQTARMYVFQYLIANADWSLVTAEGEEECCHNVDLIEREEELYTIPYDFDLSGIVDASYAQQFEGGRRRSMTDRVYTGYCRSTAEAIAAALDHVVGLRDDIIAVAAESPTIGRAAAEARAEFVTRFFDKAADDREKLLREFDRDCVGRR
jgi:hypothetical protein